MRTAKAPIVFELLTLRGAAMTETVVSAKADSFHYPGWDTIGFGLLRLAWSLIFVLAVSCLAHAQPPPIGPASYKSDKHYAVPAGPGHTKPSQLRVAAYELTYGVNYANPGVLRQP